MASPQRNFKCTRVLDKGTDPLSPFLFIIAVEGLNWMFKQAEARGLISGLEFEIEGPKITHLPFADDTLLYCIATLEDIQTVNRLLRTFEVRSGLRINYHKTAVCGVGVKKVDIQSFANALK